VRSDTISRLAAEIHDARRHARTRLVLGHGGGSFPHTPAREYSIQRGILSTDSYRGIVLVQDAAAKLNRIVVSAMLDVGENAMSVQPSGAAISENSKIVHWDLSVIKKLLEYDLIPVVYGDVGIDLRQGCCILSTEEIFRYLAMGLPVERVLIGSNVDGLYDKDPSVFSDAKQIPSITAENASRVCSLIGKSPGIDVTGGMRSKIGTLLDIVRLKNEIRCEVIDIREPNALKRALCSQEVKGTTVRAG
jgi:isopentenyl phosphate kinase